MKQKLYTLRYKLRFVTGYIVEYVKYGIIEFEMIQHEDYTLFKIKYDDISPCAGMSWEIYQEIVAISITEE